MLHARRYTWLVFVMVAMALLPARAASASEEGLATRGHAASIAALKDPKLSSQLVMLADAESRSGVLGVEHSLRRELEGALATGRMRLSGDAVQVFMEVSDLADVGALAALGATVERTDAGLGIVQAHVPAASLRAVAALPFVTKVRLPDYGFVQAGSVQSEGDAVINSDDLRSIAGVNGTGATVGVISDGVGGIGTSQASGDLPAVDTATCNVVATDPELSGAEGTALLEVVHDIAPGADLMFGHFGFGTVLDFNAAVDCLAANADVVMDDIGWFGVGPYDGTSLVSQNTADALNDAGPIKGYYTSVGNQARRHYQDAWVDSGNDVTLGPDSWSTHEFDAINGTVHAGEVAAPADRNRFLLPPGSSVSVILSWDDVWGASGNDYDLLIGQGPTVFPCSGELQDGDDDPIEGCGLTNNGVDTLELDIYIGNYLGNAAPATFDLFVLCGCGALGNGNALDFTTRAGSVPNQGDAGGAPVSVVSVGAVYQGTANQVEGFSSNGPTDDNRLKPDVVAPDGVCVTGAGGFLSGGSVCQTTGVSFFGTSAAAPHVAAEAALLLACDPALSRAQLRSLIVSNAFDLGVAGPDNVSGRGRVDALRAGALANCGPDTDGDGCVDAREATDDPAIGGTRDYLDASDFYDVLGFSGAPPDGHIDLANDILGVILHYSPNGYVPGTPALVGSGVYDDLDRGPLDPGDGWPTHSDGVIDLANDILGVILQYGHRCM